MELQKILQILPQVWCKETSYCEEEFDPENPAKCQCGSTAWVLHKQFGGIIMQVKAIWEGGETTHYYNIIDWQHYDPTNIQFKQRTRYVDPKAIKPEELEKDWMIPRNQQLLKLLNERL